MASEVALNLCQRVVETIGSSGYDNSWDVSLADVRRLLGHGEDTGYVVVDVSVSSSMFSSLDPGAVYKASFACVDKPANAAEPLCTSHPSIVQKDGGAKELVQDGVIVPVAWHNNQTGAAVMLFQLAQFKNQQRVTTGVKALEHVVAGKDAYVAKAEKKHVVGRKGEDGDKIEWQCPVYTHYAVCHDKQEDLVEKLKVTDDGDHVLKKDAAADVFDGCKKYVRQQPILADKANKLMRLVIQPVRAHRVADEAFGERVLMFEWNVVLRKFKCAVREKKPKKEENAEEKDE